MKTSAKTRRARLLADAKNPDSSIPGHCRWCAKPVAPPRRTFCSGGKFRFLRGRDAGTEGEWGCVEEWKIRTHVWFLRKIVWARDRGVCARCGAYCGPCRGGRWVADHKVPLYRGGTGALDNVQTLCTGALDCNARKTREDAALPKLEPGFQPRWLTYAEVLAATRAA